MLKRLQKFFTDARTERAIIALILLNAVILGLETSDAAVENFGQVLNFLDHALLAFFVVELLARMAIFGRAFWKDAWNVFDFIVISISLVPASGPFQVLRALRVLRVLRVISAVPSLRRVVGGLVASLPGMGSIALLMLLLFYVFSVMATMLYGKDFPELFGDLGASAFTLFAVMTLEGWVDGVVKPVMEKHPHAWLFFIPYILITTFAVLNLFIAVIVNAMQSEHDKAQKEEEARDRAEAKKLGRLSTADEAILAEIRSLRSEVKALKGGGKKARSRR
jgi:voltage-gated sodium channel